MSTELTAHSYLELIPTAERDLFFRLPFAAQEEVKLRLPMLAEIAAGSSVRGAASEIVERIGVREGCTVKRLTSLYAEFERLGWRACVNKARWGHLLKNSSDIELHEDAQRRQFLDFIGGFFQQNQRKNKPGYRKFIRHWQAGGEVPGYGTWPTYWAARGHAHLNACPHTLPPGWTYTNLQALAKPTKVELALARKGTSAALALLPPIPATRDGLRPLEFVTFDDMDRDELLCVPGYANPVRLLQLGNRDMACAYWLRVGVRPQLPNEADPAKKQRLRLSDMKMLEAVTLMDFGYPRDYVSHHVIEHGTATLLSQDASALYQVTNGHVVVCFSQMEGGLVLAWDERGKGNSRAKAGHESDHNRWHNEAADLPGQVGKDRDHSPAQNLIMTREAVALAQLQAAFTPDAQRRFKMPFACLEEVIANTYEILDRLNTREDHRLEGFNRIIQWRLKGELDWRTEEELLLWLAKIGKDFKAVQDLVDVNPNPRLETPAERWRRLCTGVVFVKPPFSAIRLFLDDHVNVKVENGSIKFRKENIQFQYWPERLEDALPDFADVRKQYLGWFVPGAMDYLILTSEDGAYLGTWKRMKLSRLDPEALTAAIQHKTSLLKQAIATVRRRDLLLPDSRMVNREADLDVNLRILADAGILNHEALISTRTQPPPPAERSANDSASVSDRDAGPTYGSARDPFSTATQVVRRQRRVAQRLTDEEQEKAERTLRAQKRIARAAARLEALYD